MTAKEFYEANATTTVNVPLSKRAVVGHPEDKSGWDGVQRARQAQYIAPDVEVMLLWDVFDFAEKFRQAGAASQGEGWVSVKDRLPEVEDDVWVWVRYSDGMETGAESWLDDDGTWAMGSAKDFTVTQWRALPAAPPKEAKQ